MMDSHTAPADLPVPSDDGITDRLRSVVVHSPGRRATSGRLVDLVNARTELA
jgi:hypothetical protein